MTEHTMAKATESPNGTEETRTLTLTPRVDVLETDDEIVVLADFPGVEPADVDIRFENGELAVHGRRANGAASYFRNFRITEQVAADKIEAELKQGVLTLRLPKVEAIKPRRIAVKG
jgi:HSP20 family protein